MSNPMPSNTMQAISAAMQCLKVYQNLYHLFLCRSSSASCSASLAAASAASFSRCCFSCSLFIPITAKAMPCASCRLLMSHHLYMPRDVRMKAPTPQFAALGRDLTPNHSHDERSEDSLDLMRRTTCDESCAADYSS